MSGTTGLDLRLPIGGLFVALGVLLAGYGLATLGDATRYAPSGGLNINLWWGVLMLVVGVLFLLAARRGTAEARPALESTEGRETERREHALGLEHEPGTPAPR